MNKLFELENKYLSAKIAYYNGEPIMSDAEFDVLEQYLKDNGSKVHEQVGAKVKDYDFSHPTKMRSLAKIQTEKFENGDTNYMESVFKTWYDKRIQLIDFKDNNILLSSPKFDGNAINVVYVNGKITSIITRGDGVKGKDVTERLKSLLPEFISVYIDMVGESTIEIRCEVVIDKNLFNEKYKPLGFANPRNYVAGVIGSDTHDEAKVSELDAIPLHFLIDGIQVGSDIFMGNDFVKNTRYEREDDVRDYENIIKYYEEIRESFKYQLDGVVFAFKPIYRGILGENSHDPEWSIAIKFIPEEAITEVIGIEWNVSKTGELTPVVLLKPVQLAGTIVKRASGYNYGYILNKGLGVNARVSTSKAGDIIPELKEIIVPSDNIIIPTHCPKCGTELKYYDIHLVCDNENCTGRIGKQLTTNAKLLGLKDIGPKTLEWFSNDFSDIIDLIMWVNTNGSSKEIENYGIKYNSRSHEIFLNSFKAIKSVSYAQVIVMMGYSNVGIKLAEQIANYYFDCDPDFTNQDRSLVELLTKEETKLKVEEKVAKLINCGIIVDIPTIKEKNENAIYVCMTGSPKEFGFATKADFVSKFDGILVDVSISSKECQYLITDDLTSTSSKMKTAQKKGIEILTYGDFYNKFN